jgi:hypothetical protein
MLYQLSYASLVERETGIGPATNSLEGCDSTTELLPRRNPLYQEGGLIHQPPTTTHQPRRAVLAPAPYFRSTLKLGSSSTFTGACGNPTLNVT